MKRLRLILIASQYFVGEAIRFLLWMNTFYTRFLDIASSGPAIIMELWGCMACLYPVKIRNRIQDAALGPPGCPMRLRL